MDLDGDGYLSMYELEYFYEEQLQRMEQLGIETLPFEDCLCQVHTKYNVHTYVHTYFFHCPFRFYVINRDPIAVLGMTCFYAYAIHTKAQAK